MDGSVVTSDGCTDGDAAGVDGAAEGADSVEFVAQPVMTMAAITAVGSRTRTCSVDHTRQLSRRSRLRILPEADLGISVVNTTS